LFNKKIGEMPIIWLQIADGKFNACLNRLCPFTHVESDRQQNVVIRSDHINQSPALLYSTTVHAKRCHQWKFAGKTTWQNVSGKDIKSNCQLERLKCQLLKLIVSETNTLSKIKMHLQERHRRDSSGFNTVRSERFPSTPSRSAAGVTWWQDTSSNRFAQPNYLQKINSCKIKTENYYQHIISTKSNTRKEKQFLSKAMNLTARLKPKLKSVMCYWY